MPEQRPIETLSDNPLFLHLYQMARYEPLQHLLEIGAGSGRGSTQILVEALSQRQDGARLYLLEPEARAFAALQARYGGIDWIHLVQRYSSDQARFPEPADVVNFYRQPGNALRRYSENEVLGWLEQEKSSYASAGLEQKGGLEHIRQQFGLVRFDLVLLDGSAFVNWQDLESVYGARIIVLAGTNTFQNQAAYLRLRQDPKYVLIQENQAWQHGFAVFKQRMRHRPGLSVIVHTRNAADLLPECLQSVAWADEKIVIDMQSTDATIETALSLGARVQHHVPVDCVDEARNWGLSLAEHAWTLVLDADERVPAELAQMIQELIHQPQALDGYWLPRRNYFFGQEVPMLFPDFQLRLFRSQQAYWRGIVHELPAVLGLAGRFPEVPESAIQHYSYRDIGDFVQRQVRYAETLWRQMGRFPVKSTPQMAHELREKFGTQQQALLDYLQTHTPDNLEWLVRQLYLFSDLAMSGVMLHHSGQLRGGGKQAVKLSAYSYLKNASRFDYPWRESLLSVLEVCDELVISYATDSDDDTQAQLFEFAARDPRIRVFATELWRTQRLGGETIRLVAEEAMAACTGDWHWHVQADEVYTQEDARAVRKLVETYQDQSVHAFRFQVLHFYADYDTLIDKSAQEIGWYQHTIRLARRGRARHYGDAWTLTLPSETPAAIVNTQIRIFHYGHVKEKEAMRRKASYMERLYHDLPEDFSISPEGQFVYDRVPVRYLHRFEDVHPQMMLARIARWRLQLLQEIAPSGSKGRKLRLLVVSRFHKIKKGFGITLNEIYQTGILQQHYEVQQLAWHYEQEPAVFDGVSVWPCSENEKLAQLRERLYDFEPDLILLHADAHFFTAYLPELQAWRGSVVGWFTVDYERAHNPIKLLPLFERCQRMLSMADVSLNQLRRDYAGPLGKVPLGVNRNYFRPAEADEKARLRQQLDWPADRFVFLMVANNFWRKGLEYALLSMARYQERHPQMADKALLYLHTEYSDSLNELIHAYGLTERVRLSQGFDPYASPMSEDELAGLYKAADAFLLTTLGEGFGMPVLEAQACGLPLIVSDNSVLREVAGEAALYVRCPGYVGGQNADSFVWMRSPDPDHAAEQMYVLQSSQARREQLGRQGLRQAANMTWHQTALLLAAELAAAAETGTLEYMPPEPGLRAV